MLATFENEKGSFIKKIKVPFMQGSKDPKWKNIDFSNPMLSPHYT